VREEDPLITLAPSLLLSSIHSRIGNQPSAPDLTEPATMKRAPILLTIAFAGSFVTACGDQHAPAAASGMNNAASFDLAALRTMVEAKNAKIRLAHAKRKVEELVGRE